MVLGRMGLLYPSYLDQRRQECGWQEPGNHQPYPEIAPWVLCLLSRPSVREVLNPVDCC